MVRGWLTTAVLLPLRLVDPRRLLLGLDVMKQKRDAPVLSDAEGSYYLTFTHRGEYLLYTGERGSTYIAVSLLPECRVSASSISLWNELWPISEQQRQKVIGRVKSLFRKQGHECEVVA
jgi:hypothetical protein